MEYKLDNLEFGALFLFAFMDFGFEPWLDIYGEGFGRHRFDLQDY